MKKYLAELIGTFVLVLMGCGCAVFTGGAGGLGQPLTIGLCFGFPLVVMAYVFGRISGCHINPAVSLGMYLDKRLSAKDFIGYIIAQTIGGILGSCLIYILVSGYPTLVTTTTTGANGFTCSTMTAFIMEAVFTCLFVWIVLAATDKDRGAGILAGLIIGIALGLFNIVGIPITGTSINPARSIGPALFQGGEALRQLWVFITAPFTGGFFAAMFWKFFKD